MTHFLSRSLLRIAAVAALGSAALLPAPAKAWGVFVGLAPVVVGPPVAYPYPYYYPPAYYGPGYYAPGYYAPGYYPPPAQAPQASNQQGSSQMSQANTPFGTTCYAGVYTCAAIPQTHVGSGCSCPGIGAPSYGVVQ